MTNPPNLNQSREKLFLLQLRNLFFRLVEEELNKNLSIKMIMKSLRRFTGRIIRKSTKISQRWIIRRVRVDILILERISGMQGKLVMLEKNLGIKIVTMMT